MAGRFTCVLIFASALLISAHLSAAPAGQIDFNRDVRPVLSENCFFCHGADSNKRKAKLRLDLRDDAIAKGAIVPRNAEASELVKRVFATNAADRMPPEDSHRSLTAAQRNTLREWIQQGAQYDTHWAFTPVVRPSLPDVKRAKWAKGAIDHFVLARLEKEKLRPSVEAPIEVLLRRVSFDLTGLPPTTEQLASWRRERDPFPAAVDELLSSPHFGERMAVDWMDVARYADTHGFNNDSLRSMWRWRDWVIEAFNRNLPYDRFITEQLAGDLVANPTREQLIATGFNRNHVINSEGGIIDEEYRVEYVADRLQTTALAWMGLTVGCARCHDHKFDPITQRDYYRLFAFFNNVDEHGEDGRVANASPIMPAPTKAQQARAQELRATLERIAGKMRTSVAARERRTQGAGDDSDFAERAVCVGAAVTATNSLLDLVVASDASKHAVVSNAAGGKPFRFGGDRSLGTTTFTETNALVLHGSGHLTSDSLPKHDTSKGWAFSGWVRRDTASVGALFSTMDFSAPPSAQSHGQGVEIRFTELGAIEVRVARRWPAYSVDVITRDYVPTNEWRHVLVACNGGGPARDVRVFLDGIERFTDIIHDDLQGTIGISGTARIGGSVEQGSDFVGALANLRLFAKPFNVEQLADAARKEALCVALKHPSKHGTDLLHAAALEKNDAEFAQQIIEERGVRAELLALERAAPSTMIMRELPSTRPTFVLFRGQYDSPREKVEPGVPESLFPLPPSAPRNRLGLAQWLTDRQNPLTARVVVNRFWQSLFGTGLVKSVEDFGFQAEFPSHPELLDWMAAEFMESGWDVKHLVRLIVNSATYRQDSASTRELNERDPENRWLARGPRQRLTAEMLRDQAIAISGLLKDELGSPPVFPYQPTNLYKGIIVAADYPGTSYVESKGDGLYRRSLYTFWKRTVPHPTLATFDAPDREVCVARRLKTNTPLQALALMNDTIQLEASRKFAERMLKEGGRNSGERIRFAIKLVTAREPASAEVKLLNTFLQKRLATYRNDPPAARALVSVGASARDDSIDVAELAAYANVASLILNLDESITRN